MTVEEIVDSMQDMELKNRVIINLWKEGTHKDEDHYEDLVDLIRGGFVWSFSDEGHEFWSNLVGVIEDGEDV